jgi:hypothetical protein
MDPSLSGIKFYVKKSQIWTGETTKFQGEVQLTASFDRQDLWNAVLERLNGLNLHRGGDIQSELIEILQGKVELLEAEVQARGNVDRERAQRAEQEASLARADAVRSKQQVELLQAQIQMKDRELAEAMKANYAWQNWFSAHMQICDRPY